MKMLHRTGFFVLAVAALFVLSGGVTQAQNVNPSQSIERLQRQIQQLEEQVQVMREKLDTQAKNLQEDVDQVATASSDEVMLEGQVSSIDASQAYLDGPYIIRIRTQSGDTESVEVPARGSGQCNADISVRAVQNATSGQFVSVRGKRLQSGAIEPCNSEDHFLRFDKEEGDGVEVETGEATSSTQHRQALPEEAASQARIARSLGVGDRGLDVKRLQELLASNSEIYPEGMTTGYFGQLTSKAVKRLQERIGIDPDGEVGTTTLNRINELLTEGAGDSGIVPPGLLKAPGLRKMMGGNGSNPMPNASGTDEDLSGQSGQEIDSSRASEVRDTGSKSRRGMPDWDSLPIDEELKGRLESTFGNQRGNSGRSGR